MSINARGCKSAIKVSMENAITVAALVLNVDKFTKEENDLFDIKDDSL